MKLSRKIIIAAIVPALLLGTVAATVAQASTRPQAAGQERQGPVRKFFDKFRGGDSKFKGGSVIQAVAQATGGTTESVQAQIKAGKTLEQIITAGGSTVDRVTAILVKPLADRLTKAVADGKITQAQADSMLAKAREHGAAMITRVRAAPPVGAAPPARMHGLPGMLAVGSILKNVAGVSGITGDELKAALHDGKTVADILAAHGKTSADVKAAVLADAKTRLDTAVSGGKLTQTQADQMLTRLGEAVDKALAKAAEPHARPQRLARPSHHPAPRAQAPASTL